MMSLSMIKQIRKIQGFAFVLLALCAAAAPTFAQSFRGSIRGTVTDPTGAAVPATKITATNLATGETREAATTDDGAYIFAELQAGEYDVTFEKQGFQRSTIRTRVSTGSDTTVDFALRLTGTDVVDVQVNDTAPLVESSNSTLSLVVDRTLVQELP